MTNFNFSIIIVNYKADNELINCIKSINAKFKGSFYEIIVVENNVKSNLKKRLVNLNNVKYIKSEKNIGYGAGCNLGSRFAKNKFLFFLNPDTLIEKGNVRDILKILSKKKVGIVAPLLLNPKKKPYKRQGTMKLTLTSAIFSLSFIYKYFPNNKFAKNFWLNSWNKKSEKYLDVVPGTAFFIKRNIFKRLNGFDENFFLFFEENDLCNRVKNLGYKILISPKLQIIHFWGKSTKQNINTQKIFVKSRRYYFKKNYGLLGVLVNKLFLDLNLKEFLIIGGILLFSLFIRCDSLYNTMQFIPDQGWFYLSARDFILTGKIPLVGPPTSHPWIHHGPLWTYVLAVLFTFFAFDPVIPAYFIAITGTITVFLFYICVKKMFSKSLALHSTILFSTSPLIVMNSRIPYHTSPIPFFVIILFLLTYFWIKGKTWVFPAIIFLLAVLYNHEITTFIFAICIFIIFIYGLTTKKKWATKTINTKIITASFFGFMLPMIPFIIYDIFYGGKQTIWFIIWIVYRVAKFPLLLFNESFISPESNPSTLYNFFSYYSDLIFTENYFISFTILIGTIFCLFYLVSKYYIFNKIKFKKILKQKFSISEVLLFLFLSIGLFGLLIHRIPIEADTLLIAPFIILATVLLYSKLIKEKYILFFVIVIGAWNSYVLLSSNYFTTENSRNKITYLQRLQAVEEIISLSNGKPFLIRGRGELSDFPVFTMPYEYLLWWKGNPVSTKNGKEIVIWEKHGKIEVYEK